MVGSVMRQYPCENRVDFFCSKRVIVNLFNRHMMNIWEMPGAE